MSGTYRDEGSLWLTRKFVNPAGSVVRGFPLPSHTAYVCAERFCFSGKDAKRQRVVGPRGGDVARRYGLVFQRLDHQSG